MAALALRKSLSGDYKPTGRSVNKFFWMCSGKSASDVPGRIARYARFQSSADEGDVPDGE
jgi:hypothetical protein